MSIGKRFTSIMLSAAMIAGNLISPMIAYAGETALGDTGQIQSESAAPETASEQEKTASAETQPVSEMPAPETEEKDYTSIRRRASGRGDGDADFWRRFFRIRLIHRSSLM